MRLTKCLEETKALVDQSESDYCIDGLSDAEISMDLALALDSLKKSAKFDTMSLKILFAPTGAIQDISIDEGWGERFLYLAAEFDAAIRYKS